MFKNTTGLIRLQKIGFLLLGFLLGSVAPVWGNLFNGVLIALTFLGIMASNNTLASIKSGRVYIGMNVLFLLYFALHTIIILTMGNMEGKPSYSMFEALSLGFILIPVYVVLLKEWLTPELIRKFLACFCIGCLVMQVYILHELIGFWYITNLKESMYTLVMIRFGDNRPILGTVYLLEMRAMGMAVGALCSYFFVFTGRNAGMRIVWGIIFALLLLFLVLTVTKSAILGFILGFIIMNVYLFRISTRSRRWGIIVCLLLLMGGGLFSLLRVEKFGRRVDEIKQDIANIKSGNLQGETIAPRVAIYKETLAHLDEFGLWGVGVYAKDRVNNWFANSELDIFEYYNVHSAFLQFWVQGGICGLLFMLYLFLVSIVKYWKKGREFPYFVSAFVVIFFVSSCFCVTLSKMNARPLILFFLALFYFYGDMFPVLLNKNRELKNSLSRDFYRDADVVL